MTKPDHTLLERMHASGIVDAVDTLIASRHTGLPLSCACALLEMESYSGRNIFGADPGGDALPRRWYNKPVTKFRYLVYRRRRRAGMTPNGVGACQLTSAGLQDAADARGGCWKSLPNRLVGFQFLLSLQKQHGVQEGFARYNGSGPAAEQYGRLARERQLRWHERFH